jgi:hypothetical protein
MTAAIKDAVVLPGLVRILHDRGTPVELSKDVIPQLWERIGEVPR